ncbi:hypothetical protein IPA_02345 [Ignicoccus pacificus DSM 13166]|uniref:NADH:ubiquinone oxidoreductase-like 20kDa subunit domain-containing protein n=1 Tax=Ignicoccus pacificus DSM 13166 TaxID=940294 RepID=A0A977KAT2_9CREN|nr:hypothetical protein IPA_02345 [Ignicoccus pacificus DSM 13166]
MSEKKTLAVLPLGGCGGCEYVIYQAIAERPEILDMYEIVYWPMVVENTELPEKVDVAIYEGVVNNYGHLKKALEMRKRAKIVISLGMCASFSGVPGLSAYFNIREILKDLYNMSEKEMGKDYDFLKPLPAPRSVPEVVPVDYIISHCPPIPEHVYVTLKDIYEGREPKIATKTVCAECPLKMKPMDVKKWSTKTTKEIDHETCYLSQGLLCLGPVTASGCGARCPRAGIPCYGCAGPTRDILMYDREDIPTKLAKEIAAMKGMDPERDYKKVLNELLKVYEPRRFYMFTLQSIFMKSKPFSLAMQTVLKGRGFRMEMKKRAHH